MTFPPRNAVITLEKARSRAFSPVPVGDAGYMRIVRAVNSASEKEAR